MSLIAADAEFLVWAAVVAISGFGFWSEKNTRLGAVLTGIITAMMTAMILSNLRVLPFESPVYDTIFGNFLPLAIPLMLFRADVVEAIRKGGKTVLAFAIGAIGIVLGALLAALLVPLDDLTALTAGLYTATYTGGSANFAGVAITADFDDGAVLTPLIAADIVATNLQTILLVALPGIAIVRGFYRFTDTGPATSHENRNVNSGGPGLDLPGAALSISLAMLLVWLGAQTAALIGRPTLAIVCTTVYALIISNFMKPLVKRMAHDFEVGLFFIFLFLVALAAGANISTMVDTGLGFFIFAMLMLVVHTTFVLLVCRFVGIDLRSAIIGSTACVGGVTSATAIASAKGWRDLIIPGIMAGTLGNAFGTLLGVWIFEVLG